MWTGPYRLFLYETRVQATLNNQTCVKGYAVSCGRKADSCKKLGRFCVDGGLIRVKRYAVSKISGLVWTGPYGLYFV